MFKDFPRISKKIMLVTVNAYDKQTKGFFPDNSSDKFDEIFGEGKKHKYSVHHYPALGKNIKNLKTWQQTLNIMFKTHV